VDFQSKPMADPVEEAGPSALAHLGGVTLILEPGAQLGLDLVSVGQGPGLLENPPLAAHNGIAELLEGLWGATFDHGSGDIPEETCFSASRKDVEDDGLVSAEGAVTPFVRVAGLIPTGDDGVTGQSTVAEAGDLHLDTQPFGS